MPTTRKKVIKTVYKDENDSENEGGDFSDSGSEAVITGQSSSDEDAEEDAVSSGDEDFKEMRHKFRRKSAPKPVRKTQFAKSIINKITKQSINDTEKVDLTPVLFSVKDLTDADKLLPSILNLSESDSSEDESTRPDKKKDTLAVATSSVIKSNDSESDDEAQIEYKDVWSSNIEDKSEEIAKKTFMELEEHKNKIESAKQSIQNYTIKIDNENESDVKDLLALGEEEVPVVESKVRRKKNKNDSDSEMEDWEEVKDSKPIPQQGLQLIVDIPDNVCRKTKKIDVEMMMKRKINRVKKEYQVYMHKVHVLCWLAHGNYVSQVINNQKLLAAALSLVPSKECYPGERVDMKYVEQITSWFKDKVTLKQDKHENKFKPKAPSLEEIMLQQIKNKVFSTKKYIVFVFVTMLRSLGLQCRVMFNFVTLPIKPPSSELCSLSTKVKEEKSEIVMEKKLCSKNTKKSCKTKNKDILQLDGNWDISSYSESDIMQVDGSDDGMSTLKTRRQKTNVAKNTKKHLLVQNEQNAPEDSVSPPKRARRNLNTRKKNKVENETDKSEELISIQTHTKSNEERNNSKQSQGNSKSLSLNRLKDKNELGKTKLSPEKTNDSNKPKIKSGTKQSQVNRNSLSLKRLEQEDRPHKNATDKMKNETKVKTNRKSLSLSLIQTQKSEEGKSQNETSCKTMPEKKITSPRKTRSSKRLDKPQITNKKPVEAAPMDTINVPEIVITDANNDKVSSKFFEDTDLTLRGRKRSRTAEPNVTQKSDKLPNIPKSRARSARGASTSKYFKDEKDIEMKVAKKIKINKKPDDHSDDSKRVSHKDLVKRNTKTKNDVTGDLVHIIKERVKEAKIEAKKGLVKDTIKKESDEDSDHLPVESPRRKISESDEDFKPSKITPRPKTISKKIDRRVLSSDDELPLNKINVWCEIFVEELEEWVAVDVIRGKVHCVNDIYSRATHPVNYVVGWDNNNYLKDLTRRYVPHWNTVTRKQRVEPLWWDQAIKPWLGPKTARDKEEDERLNQMQLEAPLPKSIAEYKNHPLYALKRHLLKFEAIYPPDAATLGFVRGEPVYARDCVYTCRSRDTWVKEAKVVKLGEQPYKVVKARPKWDKLSNKLITDKPLEVFGPWQVQDYEPPTAENGIVPRNPYGNVELFKECMLPKGTVHLKLPGLNRVAKKLNIDCAPAMTGFDFNGGWSHPVYDGFVVCKEFEETITEAWLKDQEDQERREREKIETRVYGNWKRLIRGLFIKERLKAKYGFEEPSTSQDKKKSKGPRLIVKKK